MRYLLIICSCLFFTSSITAQNELYGRVVDSLTHAPVPFASVFFLNTTIGMSTNEKGEFWFKNFASGKYDLAVSVLGYKTIQASIDFPNVNHEIEISVAQQSTQLDELVVSPDTSHRASDMQEFKRGFIGQSKNAIETKIPNTKSILLYFDPNEKELTALSKKPIEIINNALGYKIIYQLEAFNLNYTYRTQSYYGLTRFEELTPKSKAVKKRWDKERKRAYEGSFTHLIHLLQQGILDGPFVVQEFFRVRNRERPSDDFLKRKINYWQVMSSDKDDSLGYYYRLRGKPVLKDSVGKTFTKPEELLDASRKAILYTGMLRIIYKDEPEELAFAQSNMRAPQGIQVSVVHLNGKKLTLYENGYYEDVREVVFEGYIGWLEKISDMLPLGYVLPEGK